MPAVLCPSDIFRAHIFGRDVTTLLTNSLLESESEPVDYIIGTKSSLILAMMQQKNT